MAGVMFPRKSPTTVTVWYVSGRKETHRKSSRAEANRMARELEKLDTVSSVEIEAVSKR